MNKENLRLTRADLHSQIYKIEKSEKHLPELDLAITRANFACCEVDAEISKTLEQLEILYSQKNKTVRLMTDALDAIEQTYIIRRKKANVAISSLSLRRLIFQRDGLKCKNCGSNEKLCIDHIVPVKRHGDNRPSNLQTLCKSCNSKKGTK